MDEIIITINGVKHKLIEDEDIHQGCEGCSLFEECYNIDNGSLCETVFEKSEHHFQIIK